MVENTDLDHLNLQGDKSTITGIVLINPETPWLKQRLFDGIREEWHPDLERLVQKSFDSWSMVDHDHLQHLKARPKDIECHGTHNETMIASKSNMLERVDKVTRHSKKLILGKTRINQLGKNTEGAMDRCVIERGVENVHQGREERRP